MYNSRNIKNLISEDPMLGQLPDRIIAEKYGISINLVCLVRKKLKIKASHKHWKNGHRRKIDMVTLKTKVIPMLGNYTDAKIGRTYGVTRERIRQIRKIFGIPKPKYERIR